MNQITTFSIIACLASSPVFGAPGRASKSIESFQTIDPKTLKATESNIKIIPTSDAGHKTVLELTADFAKPGAATALVKTFKSGSLSARHHSAVRLYLKSHTQSEVIITLVGDYKRPDGRPTRFYYVPMKCTENWTEVTIPFSDLKRAGRREWKDNAQIVTPGGDVIEDW
jgi:hypothetical protein